MFPGLEEPAAQPGAVCGGRGTPGGESSGERPLPVLCTQLGCQLPPVLGALQEETPFSLPSAQGGSQLARRRKWGWDERLSLRVPGQGWPGTGAGRRDKLCLPKARAQPCAEAHGMQVASSGSNPHCEPAHRFAKAVFPRVSSSDNLPGKG